jgi:hypothetical protein
MSCDPTGILREDEVMMLLPNHVAWTARAVYFFVAAAAAAAGAAADAAAADAFFVEGTTAAIQGVPARCQGGIL